MLLQKCALDDIIMASFASLCKASKATTTKQQKIDFDAYQM